MLQPITPLEKDFRRIVRNLGLQEEQARTTDDYSKLFDSYNNGQLDGYGKQIIDAILSEAQINNAVHDAIKNNKVFISGIGKVKRHLLVIEKVLADMGVKLKRKIFFGELPTQQFNACAKPTPNGILCLLNTGLLKFLYNISIASFYSLYGQLNPNKGEKTSPSLQKVAVCSCISIILNYINNGIHQHSMPRSCTIENVGLLDATALAFAMRLFVLSHEIGHIALGHEGTLGRNILSHSYNDLAISIKHEQEYEADIFALKVLLHIDERHYISRQMAPGGLGFLLVHMMFLQVLSKTTSIDMKTLSTSESHPPTLDRIKNMDLFLCEYFAKGGDRSSLSSCVILQRVLKSIANSSIANEEHGFVVEFEGQ